MSFPAHIGAALEGTGFAPLLAKGLECEGSRFHSPQPLVLKRVFLVPRDWSPCPEEVTLCGTCEANLRVFQHLLYTYNGNLEWKVKREFGNVIRALGLRSWQLHAGVEAA